jgi:hypothetical protein
VPDALGDPDGAEIEQHVGNGERTDLAGPYSPLCKNPVVGFVVFRSLCTHPEGLSGVRPIRRRTESVGQVSELVAQVSRISTLVAPGVRPPGYTSRGVLVSHSDRPVLERADTVHPAEMVLACGYEDADRDLAIVLMQLSFRRKAGGLFVTRRPISPTCDQNSLDI